MKRSFTLSCLLLIISFVFSQTPGIKWQQTLGGSLTETPFYTIKTIDNGILLVGRTNSNDMGVTSHGDYDLWVEKFNAEGVSKWRKIIGGSAYEGRSSSYCYNADGSVVILGSSESQDGDVTINHGGLDIWIVKLDNNGNLLWQKSYGGSGFDEPSNIIKAMGGGYVFSASTRSNDGDIILNHGEDDAWLVKIDESGAILWQKTFGGSSYDGPDNDNHVKDIVETPDGSLIFCTDTDSNDGDVTGSHGSSDIWVIKLSGSGDVIWKNCFGGNSSENGGSCKVLPSGEIYVLGTTSSTELTGFHPSVSIEGDDLYFCKISATGSLLFQKCFGGSVDEFSHNLVFADSDGSCLLSGSTSSNDGDVIGHHGASGSLDLWILKVDGNGDILWQRTLGGSAREQFLDEYDEGSAPNRKIDITVGDVLKTSDGGILLTALTRSNDGDITGFHPKSSFDPTGGDIWVVKLSLNGILEWQRSLGGARGDTPRPPLEYGPNDYIIAGPTFSNDGDIQINHGDWDAWLIRLGAVNRIKGTLFVDQNGNGIKDAADSLFSDVTINAVKGTDTRTVVPYHGSFVIDVDTGSYNTTLTANYPYYTVTPTNHSSSFSTYFNTDSFSYALQPLAGIKDLVISAIPTTVSRPGFPLKYILYYRNVGVVPVTNAEVKFKKDARLIIQSSQPAANITVGDTLKWNIGNLDPQQGGLIQLNMTISPPPVTNVGDTLISLAIIDPVTGGITSSDDTARISQRIQGAVDPNDKAENLGGSITKERVVAGDYITYFIRFQNTGNDTAFNVAVRDTLDNKLDWNSFQMIASSHPYNLQIEDQNILVWTFYGINLPDSNVNEPGSHGYIAYRIKANNTLNIGATFLNRASIYFDFNLPVNTNYAPMLVGTPIALPLKLLDFDAQYQQPDAELKWTTVDETNVEKFIIERGTDPNHLAPVGTVAAKNASGLIRYQFKDGLANTSGNKFYYRLRMMDFDQKYRYSNIQMVNREGKSINELLVNPNPLKNRNGFAWINFERATTVELGVFDMQGRYRLIGRRAIGKGFNVVPLDLAGLNPGAYVLQAKMDGKLMVTRFVLTR